jgi:hypothetical protein
METKNITKKPKTIYWKKVLGPNSLVINQDIKMPPKFGQWHQALKV